MPTTLRVGAEWELRSLVNEAVTKGTPLDIEGGGTKHAVGRPVQAAHVLTTVGLNGIPLYEPTELVMSARAGTLLADIEAELAGRGQMLAFEPVDLGPALGQEARKGTIGAVFATNLSGARRIAAGAARDHLLGVRAVTGAGEVFKSGGRVMKNVTGYDLARGLCGSWGTLAVMTEVTFKVVPAPERTATLVLAGLPDEIAAEAMCAALGTPFEVSGAVHLQEALVERLQHTDLQAVGRAVTALRLENFAKFVDARMAKLREVLAPFGESYVLDHDAAFAFWSELRQLSVLQGSDTFLWRFSTAPRMAPKVVSGIGRYMPVSAFYDWSGGLVWLQIPPSADAGATDIRRILAIHGGHATLIRAPAAVRNAVEVFQPLDPAVARLTGRLKATFDPAGILNPRRMYG
ncbi:MAG: glycolate oxidase subunit GlcE [Hyphomicrobiaceae bacterium]